MVRSSEKYQGVLIDELRDRLSPGEYGLLCYLVETQDLDSPWSFPGLCSRAVYHFRDYTSRKFSIDWPKIRPIFEHDLKIRRQIERGAFQ